jgi:hypothetical protein
VDHDGHLLERDFPALSTAACAAFSQDSALVSIDAVMAQNAKRKRTARSRVGDWDLKMVEARLLAERMEALAGYHSRGRRFQPLTDAALKRRWLKCLRREFNAARFRRTEMDDISAELSLRGIVNVKFATGSDRTNDRRHQKNHTSRQRSLGSPDSIRTLTGAPLKPQEFIDNPNDPEHGVSE